MMGLESHDQLLRPDPLRHPPGDAHRVLLGFPGVSWLGSIDGFDRWTDPQKNPAIDVGNGWQWEIHGNSL